MQYSSDSSTDHTKEITTILARYSKLLDRSSLSLLLRQLAGEYLNIFDIPKARECLARSSALEPNLGKRVKMSLWILSLEFAKRRLLAKKLWGLYQKLIVVFPNERRRRRTGNWYFEVSWKASVSDPTSALRCLYDMRPDLQKTYPEAGDGDYGRLIQWANMVIEEKMDQHRLLSPYAGWYRERSIEMILERHGKILNAKNKSLVLRTAGRMCAVGDTRRAREFLHDSIVLDPSPTGRAQSTFILLLIHIPWLFLLYQKLSRLLLRLARKARGHQ
jgi:hypothetical protein